MVLSMLSNGTQKTNSSESVTRLAMARQEWEHLYLHNNSRIASWSSGDTSGLVKIST